jgi:hypothetical protein
VALDALRHPRYFLGHGRTSCRILTMRSTRCDAGSSICRNDAMQNVARTANGQARSVFIDYPCR